MGLYRKSLFAVSLAGLFALQVSGEEWRHQVTPYLWASGLDGEQGFGGRTYDVSAGFGDLVEFLDIGFAIHAECTSPHWGWFADVFYVKLSDSKNLPAASIGGDTKQLIGEGGVSYRVRDNLEVLGGLRYQGSESSVQVAGVGSVGSDEDWIDAFAGLRLSLYNDEHWNLSIRGDAGAGESDFVYLLAANASYQFDDMWSLILGYRYLDTDYSEKGFVWDLAQSGLGLGVGISW